MLILNALFHFQFWIFLSTSKYLLILIGISMFCLLLVDSIFFLFVNYFLLLFLLIALLSHFVKLAVQSVAKCTCIYVIKILTLVCKLTVICLNYLSIYLKHFRLFVMNFLVLANFLSWYFLLFYLDLHKIKAMQLHFIFL